MPSLGGRRQGQAGEHAARQRRPPRARTPRCGDRPSLPCCCSRPVPSGGCPAPTCVYDVGLYNVVYLAAAGLCWRGRRSGSGLRALTAALLLNVLGNAVYSIVIARMDPEPYPSIADVFYLGFYPLLYVAVLGVVRARVPRLQASMWLDGVVAALGTAAVAVAVLLGPALTLAGDGSAAVAANLAYPVADLLLLALLVASAAVLGLRADRGLLLLAAGLVGYLARRPGLPRQAASGSYIEGWLARRGLAVRDAGTGRGRRPAGARRGVRCAGHDRRLADRLAGAGAAGGVQPGQQRRAHGRLRRPPARPGRLVRRRLLGRRPAAHRRDLPRDPRPARRADPGAHRRADRAAQPPCALRRVARRPARRPPLLPAAARPRRLQGDQRRSRARGRRRPAARGRRAPARRRRRPRPWSSAWAATSSPSCCRGRPPTAPRSPRAWSSALRPAFVGRRTCACRCAAASASPTATAPTVVLPELLRRADVAMYEAKRSARRRRCLQRGARRRHGRPAAHGRRAADGARRGPAPGAPPAARRTGAQPRRGGRGAGAVAAPDARACSRPRSCCRRSSRRGF